MFFAALFVSVLALCPVQDSRRPAGGPGSLGQRYDAILENYARGQFQPSVAELRAWPPGDIDEVFDAVRADRRWTARQTRAAALIHTEIGAEYLRADRSSAEGLWHFGVAEQALRMRPLWQDVEFRRDWYIAATAEFHRAKLHMEARRMLAEARRELPESSALFFASGVTDEEIARLDAPAVSQTRPERVISDVNQARRRFLEDARGHFRSAARLAPNDTRIQLHLGRVLALLDDQDALQPLQLAATVGDVETRFMASMFAGGFHQQRRRPGEAIKWYEQATRLIPGASPADIALSQALQQIGRGQDARRILIESTKGAS
jgi:tetratricopeptide (TPR) repeat protein